MFESIFKTGMSIGRRKKGNIIEIQFQEPKGEIESYTLLYLTPEDVDKILSCLSNSKNAYSVQPATGLKPKILTIMCAYHDAIDLLWGEIYTHKQIDKEMPNVSKKYLYQDNYSFYLIRNQQQHDIKLVQPRDEGFSSIATGSINVLPITRAVAAEFKKDFETLTGYSKGWDSSVQKAAVDTFYKRWNDYMNRMYFENVKKYKF